MKRKNIILYIITLLLTVASVTLITFISFKNFYKLAEERQVELCENALGEEAAEINEYLSAAVNTVSASGVFVDSMIGRNADIDEIKETFYAVSEKYMNGEANGFTGIYGWVSGTYLDGTGWDVPADYDATTRIWYTEAVKANGSITTTAPYTDAETGKTVITVCLMLSDKKSVIATDIDVAEIREVVANIGSGDAGYGFVVNKKGDMLAHGVKAYEGINIYAEGDEKPTDKMIEIIESIFQNTDSAGGEYFFTVDYKDHRLMVFSHIIRDDWYAGMVLDYDSVFENEMSVLFKSILLSLITVGIVAYFCTSSVISRNRLIDGTRELKEIAEEEKRASVEKSRFLANMSHEIRTPINAVLGMNEMVLRECSDKNILKYANNIQSAGKSLLSIVNDILDFSKIEAGEMPIFKANFRAMTLLSDCCNVISQKARDKGLRLTVYNNRMTPAELKGDETRLRQIFINLSNNAIKYTSEGVVTIEFDFAKTSEGMGTLIFTVSDTGIGISDTDKEKLFKSFKRLDEKKNKGVEGTGLGLSIAKQLTELMGGTISFESVYTEGSRFSVSIPTEIIDDTPMGAYSESKTADIKNITSYSEKFRAPDAEILVVDDVQMNLDVFKGLLKKTCVKITCALNGYDAIDLARVNHYDIIFLDHLMPDIDGIETLKELNVTEDYINRNTPVIVLTANAVAGAKEEYLAAGFSDYLAKPIVGGALEDMVYKYLPKSKIEWVNGKEAEKDKVNESAVIDARVNAGNVSETTVISETVSEKIASSGTVKETIADNIAVTGSGVKVISQTASKTIAGSGESTGTASETDLSHEIANKNRLTETLTENHQNLPHRFISKLKHIVKTLFDTDKDITVLAQNIAIVCMVGGGIVRALTTKLINGNLTSVIAILGCVVIGILYLYISYKDKHTTFSSIFAQLVCLDVLFPMLYFNCGGIYSGMPMWFVFGLFMPWVVSRGKASYMVYFVTLFTDVSSIIISILYPETVSNPLHGNLLATDVTVGIITLTVFVAVFLKIQEHVFERQKGSLKDRTESLDKTLSELETVNKEKTEFLANMSHEIRTPIHAILGYSRMIEDESKESKTLGYAENIEQSGRNLLSVVSDIFDFTEADNTDFEVEFKEAKTIPGIIDILSYARYNADKKDLTLSEFVDPTIPSAILGDAERYVRVAIKLVSNAVRYTANGKIEIVFVWKKIEGTDKGELIFSVSDTGVGMKPEEVDLLKQNQLTGKSVMSIEGAGIGLAYAARILKKMGSEIKVESRYGCGSRFWFTIRPHIIDETPIGEITIKNDLYRIKKSETVKYTAASARVLVVDDNEMNLDLIGRFLSEIKVTIEYAEDGAEAVELVRKNPYDVILMDHMLPVMDGIEAFKVIRDEHLCDNTPIVIVTANAVAGEKKKYLDMGFDAYLAKPIDKKELLSVVKEMLPEKKITESAVSDGQNGETREEVFTDSDSDNVSDEDTLVLTAEDEEFLKKLDFLDTETGLMYTGNDMAFFKAMLKSYAKNSRIAEIKEAYLNKNFDNYRTFVHAVKGTSLTIGAIRLSEHMKAMEEAARDGKTDEIIAHHDEYIKEYEDLVEKILKAIGE